MREIRVTRNSWSLLMFMQRIHARSRARTYLELPTKRAKEGGPDLSQNDTRGEIRLSGIGEGQGDVPRERKKVCQKSRATRSREEVCLFLSPRSRVIASPFVGPLRGEAEPVPQWVNVSRPASSA